MLRFHHRTLLVGKHKKCYFHTVNIVGGICCVESEVSRGIV